jgi:ATP-dependent helicase HepA
MDEQLEPGQRWVNTNQPELGLGILEEAGGGRITLFFAAAGEKKVFSLASAPVLRVRFKRGDEVLLRSGKMIEIGEVEENGGLLTYHAEGQGYPEQELDDAISFSKPDDRLLGGQVDDLRTFHLRVESLFRSAKIRESSVRGFLGGRVDLLPHQLSIVREVSSRLEPRVLLADEVGLGKTIEACLILNRLHLTGRADRILILVPEPLVHQWFVELFRRFQYRFALFDEERCRAIPEGNPFLEEQLVICSQEFFSDHPARIPEVMEAGWDLLIVDEAHHLEWSPEEVSEGYELVQALAAETPSVLLLTATPQQLGVEGHFARLQLLDPHRYSDLETFLEESNGYEEVADVVDVIREGGVPATDFFADRSERFQNGLAQIDEPGGRQRLVEDLLDSFGTGRVMFRNTRKQLSGFPERKAHLIELTGEDAFQAKVDWLVGFLASRPEIKVLLICKSLELVEEITGALLDKVDMKIAQFHEELTLMQRDRNAAYFAEEDGARLLICSEIGSEGRNFQFAHHLVLFDLPENPEMLEQRIGRLDRIGQRETIQLHVPFVTGDPGERYARWYQEGLNAFEKNLPGAETLVKRLQGIKAATLDDFITQSQRLRDEIEQQMERGVDRLLALTSQGREEIDDLLELIDDWDHDRTFEDWVLRLFDHFGLEVEEMATRSYLLKPGHMITDAFPELPEDGMSVTFDRNRALSREEIGLMTADHPMVRDSFEILLSSEAGNSAFGVWEVPGPKAIILEAYFVVECVAPASLQTDHFLPPVPVRVAVDHQGQDLTSDAALMKAVLRRGNHRKLLEQPKVTGEIIPTMLKALETLAAQRKVRSIKKALGVTKEHLGREESRLRDLAEINPLIDERDLEKLDCYRKELTEAIGKARLRLDSLRLIYRMPAP